MILEVAILDVKAGQTDEFEIAFAQALPLISLQEGCLECHLQHCLERPNRYLLLVQWSTLENHTIGFRQSVEYQEWKRLLHHFYEPFPEVEHYQVVHQYLPDLKLKNP